MAHYSKEEKTKLAKRYWVFGEKKHPAVFLLPGFTGTHHDIAALANSLKEKYFVIIPEFPGWENARLEPSSYTIHSYAVLVKEMIEEMGFKKIPLIAHCMGATVALETAYKYPDVVSQLLLISTPYQDGTLGKNFFLFLTHVSEKMPRKLRPLFFFWRSRIITVPISFFVLKTRTLHKKLRIILDVVTKQQHQNEHVLETNWNSLIMYNYQKLSTLCVPVHLFHGGEDMLILPKQAKKLAAIIPGSTLSFIPHAGHLPPVETPGTVVKLIEKYLH